MGELQQVIDLLIKRGDQHRDIMDILEKRIKKLENTLNVEVKDE